MSNGQRQTIIYPNGTDNVTINAVGPNGQVAGIINHTDYPPPPAANVPTYWQYSFVHISGQSQPGQNDYTQLGFFSPNYSSGSYGKTSVSGQITAFNANGMFISDGQVFKTPDGKFIPYTSTQIPVSFNPWL